MKCKHGSADPPCSFCRQEAREQELCLGLFGPCGKSRDPQYDLQDPDGQEPPIYRCTGCGVATDDLFERADRQGKLPALEAAVNEARALAERERA